MRLSRKSRCRFEGLTHEKLVVEGVTAKLPFCIEHFSYRSYSELFKKLDDYSSEVAAQMYSEGKRAGPADAFLHGLWMFFRNYFLRLGFVAGFDGFLISLTKGIGTFLKYAKLYELRKFPDGRADAVKLDYHWVAREWNFVVNKLRTHPAAVRSCCTVRKTQGLKGNICPQ